MSRPKAFDPDIVLGRAMDVFWSQGYEATSVQDLTDHLGIGRASLYATFGDKRSLYLQALEHYRTNEAAGLVCLLASADPVLPAIRRVLDEVVEDAVGTQPSRGCLAVNATTGVPGAETTTSGSPTTSASCPSSTRSWPWSSGRPPEVDTAGLLRGRAVAA